MYELVTFVTRSLDFTTSSILVMAGNLLLFIFGILSLSIHKLPSNAFTMLIKFTLWCESCYGLFVFFWAFIKYIDFQASDPDMEKLINIMNIIEFVFLECSLYAGLILTWYCYYIINQRGYMKTIQPVQSIAFILSFEAIWMFVYISCRLNYRLELELGIHSFQLIIVLTRVYLNLSTYFELQNLKKFKPISTTDLESTCDDLTTTNLSDDSSSEDSEDRTPQYNANDLIASFILVFTASDIITWFPFLSYFVLRRFFDYKSDILFVMFYVSQSVKGMLHLALIYNHRLFKSNSSHTSSS
jgi:hypothetical protein